MIFDTTPQADKKLTPMITLTVKVPSDEVDALRFACTQTDEALYVHESVDESAMVATVTMEVRSIELLFYLVRSFDAKVELDRFKKKFA